MIKLFKILKIILKVFVFTLSVLVPLVLLLLDLLTVFNGTLLLYQDQVFPFISYFCRIIFFTLFIIYALFVLIRVMMKDRPNFSYLILAFFTLALSTFGFYFYDWYIALALLVAALAPGVYITLRFFGFKV